MSKKNNMTPEQETRENDFESYQKIVMLVLLPLLLYFFWSFIYDGNDKQEAAIEDGMKRVEQEVEERSSEVNVTKTLEATSELPRTSERPITPSNTLSTVTTAAAAAAAGIKLTMGKGDEIEYMTEPQNVGWKGIVKKKSKTTYEVEITEVLMDNEKRDYLVPNPCTGGKLIGKDFVGRMITIPGYCVHQ